MGQVLYQVFPLELSHLHPRPPSSPSRRGTGHAEHFDDLPKVEVSDMAGTQPQAGLTPLASVP